MRSDPHPPEHEPFVYDDHTSIVEEIANERSRQVEDEGRTPGDDDCHIKGELARAAAYYALPERFRHDAMWPWGDFRKPKDRRRDLVRAGALIIAEIERFDRLLKPTT